MVKIYKFEETIRFLLVFSVEGNLMNFRKVLNGSEFQNTLCKEDGDQTGWPVQAPCGCVANENG